VSLIRVTGLLQSNQHLLTEKIPDFARKYYKINSLRTPLHHDGVAPSAGFGKATGIASIDGDRTLYYR
jgi:hypothetical protein